MELRGPQSGQHRMMLSLVHRPHVPPSRNHLLHPSLRRLLRERLQDLLVVPGPSRLRGRCRVGGILQITVQCSTRSFQHLQRACQSTASPWNPNCKPTTTTAVVATAAAATMDLSPRVSTA
jgi:hypothetical protein